VSRQQLGLALAQYITPGEVCLAGFERLRLADLRRADHAIGFGSAITATTRGLDHQAQQACAVLDGDGAVRDIAMND